MASITQTSSSGSLYMRSPSSAPSMYRHEVCKLRRRMFSVRVLFGKHSRRMRRAVSITETSTSALGSHCDEDAGAPLRTLLLVLRAYSKVSWWTISIGMGNWDSDGNSDWDWDRDRDRAPSHVIVTPGHPPSQSQPNLGLCPVFTSSLLSFFAKSASALI